MGTNARPEAAISENFTSRVSDRGMQNASVSCWSQIDSLPPNTGSGAGDRNTGGLHCVELYDSKCHQPDQPKANLEGLYASTDKFTFAGKEIQDALDALRKGDLKEGKQELGDAIAALNEGLEKTRDGVGGDFDLSELPESNPLRRVGSGRSAIRGGRSSLQDALDKLNAGENPDISSVLKDVESGMVQVLGGNANVQKAVGLIERGEQDHRPKHDCPEPEQPPTCRPEERPPVETPPERGKETPAPEEKSYHLHSDHQLHNANRHLGKAGGSLREAIGEILNGDFNHAMKELKGTLHQIQEGTHDLRAAFGGEIPGNEHFINAESQVFKAVKSLRNGDFDDAIGVIRKALRSLRAGRSDVHDAATDNSDD